MGDDRLSDLEARYAWLERHITEQDKAMAEIGEDVRRLRRELEALRARIRTADDAGEGTQADERPPHY